MSWIEDRLQKREDQRARISTIRSQAISIYEALWREIVAHVAEAKQKGILAFTNGAVHKKAVNLSVQPREGESHRSPDEVIVSLDDNRAYIQAQGARVSLRFDMDVCRDGTVCLKLKGEEISVTDAAIRILDPFLFPDLQ